MVVSVVNMTILPKKYEQELKDHRDSQNKDRLHQATLKETEVEKVKAIFKNSNGLDNISEEDMKIFSDFMHKKRGV